MNYPQQVTMVDDLPELDDLMGGYMGPPAGGHMGPPAVGHMPGRGFSGFRGQPPPPEVPDVSGVIRGSHIPPMESGMIGPPRITAHNMAGGGYNRYGAAYGPQTGPGPHRPPQPVREPFDQRMMVPHGVPVMDEDINPYPFADSPNSYEVSVPEGYKPNPAGNCLDVNNHIENCPICRRIYKNDKTILIIAIVLLSILCLLLLKKVLNI